MSMLEQMEFFYFVATWKSFSRAALELGVSKGFVSKQINELEKKLGTKLLQRTTRHLNLTEDGHIFFESCTKIMQEKKQATLLLKKSQAEPAGHLKLTAPPSLCSTVLAELLPKFQRLYPNISLMIDSSPTVKNLLQHGIDVALRITHTPDERYIARVLTTFRFVICATPQYLKRNDIPKKPQDLLTHNCLIYYADPAQNRWPFQLQGNTEVITVQSNLTAMDSILIKNMVLASHGIARLPEYVVTKEIKAHKLKSLFTENLTIETPIYAIYASNVNIPLKIKKFVEFLKDNLVKFH